MSRSSSRVSGFRSSTPAPDVVAEDVRQTHQLHELEQVVRRTAQVDLAASPAGCELEACERIDRDRVGIHAGDVASDDDTARAEHGADALAESREVPAGDRAADGEGDLVRPGCEHRFYDRSSG